MQRIQKGCLFVLLLLAACSGMETVQDSAQQQEVLRQREHTVQTSLVRDVEERIGVSGARSSPLSAEVQIYLRNVAERLASHHPELKGKPIGVLLIGDIRDRWRTFGLPGNRLYVSRSLIRQIEFENQGAALLAFELAHLARHSLAERIESKDIASASSRERNQKTENELFGEGGVLTFDEKAHVAAVGVAVNLLYAAGYDARGLVKLFATYQKNPAQNPYGESTIKSLEDVARRAVAFQSPLRNPIIRSADFVRISERLKNL